MGTPARPLSRSGEFFCPAEGEQHVNEQLKQLRDAVTGRNREVEVGPDGTVHEVKDGVAEEPKPDAGKATKLAARTFGR